MVNSSVQQWMSTEMERLSLKWERYKPAASGYNRIHSARLSKSVTQMLNNPLPAEDRLGASTTSALTHQRGHQRSQVLSHSQSVFDEFYPAVQVRRQESDDQQKAAQQFVYYRNCSTRVT